MLDKLQSTDFQPHLHQIFRIRLEDTQDIDLELVKVTELGAAPQPSVRSPFLLHFLGPVNPQYLKQHTYHLEHEEMGSFDFFIVPLGFEAGRMRYEAIFT